MKESMFGNHPKLKYAHKKHDNESKQFFFFFFLGR